MPPAIAVVVALFSVAACATRTAKPPPLSPALQSLAFYVGEWSCKGTTFPTADQKSEHWDAKLVVAPELDGTWLSVQMIGPGMNRTVEHKGYDPTTKKWIHVAVGTEGSWGTVSSPGWTGDQMVFVSDDKTDRTRATFTKIDERHYSHGVSREADRGSERLWEKVCSKR